MSEKNNKQHNKIKQNEIESDNMSQNEKKFIKANTEENIEETTKYGEFVSSYFVWLTPERQKKRAKEINDMTKKE